MGQGLRGWGLAVGLWATAALAAGPGREADIAVMSVRITSPGEGAVVGNAQGPLISACVLNKDGGCAVGGSYRYLLSLDGVEYPGSGGATWSHLPSPHLPEGDHTVFVRVSPALGSGSVAATSPVVHFSVDATPPNTTLIGSLPASPTTERNVSFAFSSSDTGARFQCALEAPSADRSESFDDCTSPKRYTGLGYGAHTFLVRSIDAVGNVDPTPATHTWTVSALETRITRAPSSPTPSTSAVFEFTTSGGVRYECALDAPGTSRDEPFSLCTSPRNYADLGEGTHLFSVRAFDGQGRADDTPATHAWTVDLSRPDVRIDAGPPRVSRERSAEFRFSSTRTDVGFECGLDGAALMPCHSPMTLTVAGDEGSHTFAVRAVSGAGKRSATATQDWAVDTTPPEVLLLTPADGERVARLAPDVGGTVDDPASTVTVFIDETEVGETVADDAGKWRVRLTRELAQGPHTARARALNPAGHEGHSELQRFSVDTSLPEIPAEHVPDESSPVESSPVEPSREVPGLPEVAHLIGGGVGCSASAGAFSLWSVLGVSAWLAGRRRRAGRSWGSTRSARRLTSWTPRAP